MRGRDAARAVLRAALRRDMTGWMPNMCESGGCTYVFDMELDDGYSLRADVDVLDPTEPVGFSVSIECGFRFRSTEDAHASIFNNDVVIRGNGYRLTIPCGGQGSRMASEILRGPVAPEMKGKYGPSSVFYGGAGIVGSERSSPPEWDMEGIDELVRIAHFGDSGPSEELGRSRSIGLRSDMTIGIGWDETVHVSGCLPAHVDCGWGGVELWAQGLLEPCRDCAEIHGEGFEMLIPIPKGRIARLARAGDRVTWTPDYLREHPFRDYSPILRDRPRCDRGCGYDL